MSAGGHRWLPIVGCCVKHVGLVTAHFWVAGWVVYRNIVHMHLCFIIAVLIFRCKIPGLDNDTWGDSSPAHKALVKFYIPPSDTYPYDRCHLYDRGNLTVRSNTSIPMVKCNEWVYSTAVFQNTFTQQVGILSR